MFYPYILASQRNGTLYTRSTDDICRRVWEHREKVRRGFSADYDVRILVWYEAHPSRESAMIRETRIKHWNRESKLRLIERNNPSWRDLYDDLNN